jgi:anti-sigma factor RsiW
MNAPMTPDDDTLLIAYIDNALDEGERGRLIARLAGDAELRGRLERIRAGESALAPAFAALLDEAPLERLRASLAAASSPASPAGTSARVMTPTRRVIASGFAIALFLAGFAAGRLGGTQEAAENHENWHQAVAEYMSLYTADTFAGAPSDPAVQAASLNAVGLKIGTALTPERVAVPNLPFKLAILLTFETAPLGELVYLDPQNGPVLFCIIAKSQPDAPVRAATMAGFATATWAHDGRGFMVIGRLPEQKIADIANDLVRRF